MILVLNRSFAGFLLFLLTLCLTFAAGVWWLGPAVVSLAADGNRRGEPYYVLHLASVPEAVDGGLYFERLRTLVREEQGRLLWRGGLSAVHTGRLADERDNLLVYEFGTGGDLVQMLTSSAYRDLAGQVPPVLLGTAVGPLAIAQDEVLLLWLLRLREGERDSGRAGLLDPVVRTAERFDGQSVWSTPLDSIAGQGSWDYLVVLAFPDPVALSEWLSDSTTATELALARKSVTSQTLLEFSGNQ